jgi:large subunit ribosomal protein L31e
MTETEKTSKKEAKIKETVEEPETEEELELEETGKKAEELEETEEEAMEEVKEAEKTKEPEEKVEAEEAEEKGKKGKKEEAEEEIVEERIYTIPLSRAWIVPPKKRTPRAVRIVKSFIQKHMKIKTEVDEEEGEEPEKLVLSNEVNQKIWSRGIKEPPRNIRVRAVKDKEGVITVYLAEGD